LQAQPVSTTFTYKQTDAATGSGTISGFVVHAEGGDITFAPTPMPSALVINPGTGQFVGKQTVQSGNSNEPNSATGLVWNGSVLAIGTRGSEIYTVQIPLVCAKVTQSPDTTITTGTCFTAMIRPAGMMSSARFLLALPWYSRDDD
jgi:hypothetical protein